MGKLAFVFAGQGSQYVNMGLDFLDHQEKLFQFERQANTILGYNTRERIASDDGSIHETQYTQPLVLLSTIYAYETLQSLGIYPDGVCGFSLGEYAALYASKVFSFDEIIKLVSSRASIMHDETKKHPGAMAAILGLSSDVVDNICQEIGDSVYAANYNSPQQTVISGTEEAILRAIEVAKHRGVKRAMKLQVSGAFHSPLMMEASTRFEGVLHDVQPRQPMVPIYLNTTARKANLESIKKEMIKQISSPVRFVEAINEMKKDGFTHFIEVGPGAVLSGLIRKIDSDLHVINCDHYTDIETVKGWLKEHGFIK